MNHTDSNLPATSYLLYTGSPNVEGKYEEEEYRLFCEMTND
jgi:hypothetical protein